MVRPWVRACFTLGALLMLVSGIVTVAVSQGGAPAAAEGRFTIDILPGALGFNPDVCTVNRNNSTVFFRNIDSKPRRVVVRDPGGPVDPRMDTGVIEPGANSLGGWLYTAIAQDRYEDADNAALKGTIIVPIGDGAASDCIPRPPTPTPTNTPTITPTRQPTPIPQKPGRCIGLQGCGLAPDVRKDESN